MHILLLEDDPDARQFVRDAAAAIELDALTIREAESVAQSMRMLEQSEFDVFLADLVLPDGEGINAIRFACALPHPPTVLAISSVADEDVVVETILAGAKGYVCKLDAPEEISRAIAIAAAGGSSISATIAQRLIEVMRRQAATTGRTDILRGELTECERSVLQLAAEGRNYRRIAEITGTRPSTVYTHVRHIYEKLHVSNLAQALYEARRLQLV